MRPVCDATRQEFGRGHAIGAPARWHDAAPPLNFQKRLVSPLRSNGGGCIVELRMSAVLLAIEFLPNSDEIDDVPPAHVS